MFDLQELYSTCQHVENIFYILGQLLIALIFLVMIVINQMINYHIGPACTACGQQINMINNRFE